MKRQVFFVAMENFHNCRPLAELELYSDNYGNEYIKALELRYGLENNLIKAVSQGNYKALKNILTSDAFVKGVEPRLKDSLRNLKNYMIIFNTLMRKGAELGNVHPFYIHTISSDFAERIEECRNEEDIKILWTEMARSYCQLVKNHSAKGYSPLVQNILMIIDAELEENLTLSVLAKRVNVNSSYLSSLFKKDTGYTLTEYVNLKRIELAKRLLTTTSEQVQSISHDCGILDVNYFVKIFKKNTGKTPKQYREENKKLQAKC